MTAGDRPAGEAPDHVSARSYAGVGEVTDGADLAALLLDALAAADDALRDGDVVLVTSKVVSKAEGRRRAGERDEHLAAETERVVARRGPTTIVRTHHGLVMAGAGIDASNTEAGTILLLPTDPDASARRLRAELHARTGRRVAVVVTDTAGRAWRHGQTDLAIGLAGLEPLDDHAGRVDHHGNTLAVTAPAIADELAGLGDLVKGKLSGRPFAVVRGLGDRVLAADDDGPGARALTRAAEEDLFGLGARDAVLTALGDDPDLAGFGAALDVAALPEALAVVLGETEGRLGWTVEADGPARASVRLRAGDPVDLGWHASRVATAAAALGWAVARVDRADTSLALELTRPSAPPPGRP